MISARSSSKLKINIISNFLGMMWSVFSIYLFIPFYIKYLNAENYGLVMFAVTLQAVISLFDAGFSSALRREYAVREKTTEFINRSISLLKTIERFYGLIFVAVISIAFVFAEVVGQYWFQTTTISAQSLKLSIILMVIIAVIQMQSGLYNGALQALEEQLLSNSLQFFYTLFRNGFVIFVIMYWSSPVAFLGWQLCIGFIYILIQRSFLIRILSSYNKSFISNPTISFTLLKQVWKVSSLFLLISILSTINLQIDKLMISKMLPLHNLGYYNTSYSFGQIIVSICTPLATAISPVLIRSYAQSLESETINVFHRFSKINTVLLTALGTTLILNSSFLINFWTQNQAYTMAMIPVTNYMVIAGMLLAAQIIPYNLAVASADLKPIVYTCIVNISLTLPAYYWGIKYYGLKGCAAVWMISNVFMLLINVYYYLRKSMSHQYVRWLLSDILIPAFITGTICIFLNFIKPTIDSPIFNILSIGLTFFISFCIGLLLFFYKDLQNSKLIKFLRYAD
jgi:O-antigen/teichoic acid export membrane protein